MSVFRETVDSIVAEFNYLHTRLVKHAEKQAAKAEQHRRDAGYYGILAQGAEVQERRARAVAAKLADLVA